MFQRNAKKRNNLMENGDYFDDSGSETELLVLPTRNVLYGGPSVNRQISSEEFTFRRKPKRRKLDIKNIMCG